MNDSEYMIDRALGVHFAADPEVANSFIEERINGRLQGAREGGRMIRVILPPGPYLGVPQKKYTSGATETDQYAIEKMACGVAYRELPELLSNYLVQARKIPENVAPNLAMDLALGKTVTLPDGAYDLNSFLDNFHGRPYNPEDRIHVVQMARTVWLQKGYAGLQYINTSPMEMATASDPTCYLVFPDASGRLPIKY